MRIRPSYVRLPLAACVALAASHSAFAAEVNPSLLTQSEFRLLSEDLSAVVSFKPMIPAESMGITGIDAGIAVTGTRLQNRAVWQKAAAGSSIPSTLPIPTLRLHKGLPLDIDVGLAVSKVPGTNIKIAGGELRWAFVPGSTVMPALAVRGSYSALSGVDNLDFRTMGLDVSISKGFAFVTPYAGVGTVSVKSKPDAPGLSSESFSQGKVFAGVNFNMGLANVVLETDKTGKATSYGVKFGFRF